MSLQASGPLEQRDNPTHWERLLDIALPMLDHVYGRENAKWTLGGGTAIALRIGHRLSDDVDLFVPGVEFERSFLRNIREADGLPQLTF